MSSLHLFAVEWLRISGAMLVQNTIFLLLVLLLLAAWRKLPARIKYFILIFSMIKLLIPPVANLPFSHSALASNLMKPVTASITLIISASANEGVAYWPELLFLTWLAIVVILLAIPLYNSFKLVRQIRILSPLVLPEYLLSNNIAVYESRLVSLPLSLKLIKSCIVLPSNWRSWPVELQKAVIAHERAHIRQYDSWLQLLQILVRAFYFYHPLVWLLCKQMDGYREMVCDDQAIRHSAINNRDYAHHLLRLSENYLRNYGAFEPGNALIRRRNQLLHRITYQLQENTMKKISKIQAAALSCLLLALLVIFSMQCSKKEPGQSAIKETQETLLKYAKEPELVSQVQPSYPELARKAGMQANFLVKLLVKKDGQVGDASITKTSPFDAKADTVAYKSMFEESALGAVKQWKFKPAEKDGMPVDAWIMVTIRFKLQ
jgi:TonB family protein